MSNCAHQAYSKQRARLARDRARRPAPQLAEVPRAQARLALIREGFAPQPPLASDFKLLAMDDFARKIPVRAKIHICRAWGRCETSGSC